MPKKSVKAKLCGSDRAGGCCDGNGRQQVGNHWTCKSVENRICANQESNAQEAGIVRAVVLGKLRAKKKAWGLRLARPPQARYKFSDERLGNVSISLSAREAVLAFA